MFIRTKTSPRSKSISVQLVESFRLNGKVMQRVIRHFGTADTEEKLIALKKLATALHVELKHKKLRAEKPGKSTESLNLQFGKLYNVPNNAALMANDLEEVGRHILGIHDVYGYVYRELGFSNPFYNPARQVHAAKILREIVLARIACPASKRASVAFLDERCGVNINLDHVYQMMDKVDDTFCAKIQDLALASTLKLTGEKLRILFYDATTLYFESFTEDELKQNGYSKDMKFNQPQVLLTLFVTEEGLPVGYEIFPGATYEGHTLVPVLENLKKRYQISQLIFVADRGLLSEENLKYLEDNDFEYIVGARIKNMPKGMKAKILNEFNQQDYGDTPKKFATFECTEKQKLLVSYSEERAKKDKSDREKSIEKLQKKLLKSRNPKSLLNNYGYKKYIEMDGEITIKINTTKETEDAKWDGLLGVITNNKNLNPEQIFANYKALWQIEECFRVNKHDLKIRPIYHWTPNRVKAHIAISFMAFVCVRYLEHRAKIQSQKLSPETIRQSLLQVQASIIKDKKTENEYLLPAKTNPHAKDLYRILGIRYPEKIMLIR